MTPFYTPFIELKKIYRNKDQKLASDSPTIALSSVNTWANCFAKIENMKRIAIIKRQLNFTAASEYYFALGT